MDPSHLSTSPDSPGQAGSGPSAVSLAALLERDVPLDWYEAVAVVAGLCATLIEQQMSGVPQPDGVSLTRDGRVTASSRAQRLGAAALPRLLHGLLPDGSTPAPLRLFVLHAMAPESQTDIKSFAASLEYYERPGRESLVQAAYRRVLETPADHRSDKAQRLQLEDAEAAPNAAPARRAWPRVAVAALLVGMAGAVVYGISASSRAVSPPSAEGTGIVMPTAQDIEAAARAVTTSVRERLAAVIGAAPSAPVAPAPEAAAPRAGRPAAAAPRRSRSAAPPARGATPAAVAPPVAEAAGEPPAAAAPAEPELVAFPFATVEGTLIYSSSAPDVEPPLLRDPHRLPGSLLVAPEGPSNAMELVISETGAVERVTMVGPSAQMTDMMILGAAKTWKFDPATRAGEPVKYRLRLDRAAAP